MIRGWAALRQMDEFSDPEPTTALERIVERLNQAHDTKMASSRVERRFLVLDDEEGEIDVLVDERGREWAFGAVGAFG